MWPFSKRQPKIQYSEWLKQQPPAPCGEQAVHYYWTLDGYGYCPACAAAAKREAQAAERRLLAKEIAAELFRLQQSTGNQP